MIFLETSFLIALYVKKDKHHRKAIEIEKKIRNKQKIINKMVIYEVLTVLRKKKVSSVDVKKCYNNLINLIVLDDSHYHTQALIDSLNNELGFFDNLHHVLMIENEISEIASFDNDFDYFDDIKRVF